MDISQDDVEIAAKIICAYVSNNPVSRTDLVILIDDVTTAVTKLGEQPVPEPVIEAHAHATPAAIRKSITPEAIICFECGLGFKSIKRHLLGHDLTPDAYRSRWGLAANYPLVSSSYSEQRSALAKAIGLGKKR